MKQLMSKYKSVILYIVFGLLTTIVNIAVYYAVYEWMHLSNVLSVFLAWTVSVVFAFYTNKQFVFESVSFRLKTVFKEFSSFVTGRAFTGALDLLLMYLLVDVLLFNNLLIKCGSNVIVIVLNYIFSKFFIFQKKKA